MRTVINTIRAVIHFRHDQFDMHLRLIPPFPAANLGQFKTKRGTRPQFRFVHAGYGRTESLHVAGS